MTKQQILNTLKDYKKLKYNWNGEGANPIKHSVIDKAIRLVNNLWTFPNNVFPLEVGAIQLEFDGGEDLLELEVFEDKIKFYLELDEDSLEGDDISENIINFLLRHI